MTTRLTATEIDLGTRETSLATFELENFAYHLSALYRERGTFGLSRPDGTVVEVTIAANPLSATDGDIWDGVTINGHSVGNRHGAARAYARFWASEAEWWRAR